MTASTHSLDLRAIRMNEPPDHDVLQAELTRLKAHLQRNRGAAGGPSAGISDVAQEAAYRMLQQGDHVKFESPAAMRGYLWATAKRLILDRFRRTGRRQKIFSADSLASELPVGEPVMGADDREPDMLRALQRLAFEDRRLLELAYMHDASIGEISKELGITEDAVRMRLVRARQRLRDRLQPPAGPRSSGPGTRNV